MKINNDKKKVTIESGLDGFSMCFNYKLLEEEREEVLEFFKSNLSNEVLVKMSVMKENKTLEKSLEEEEFKEVFEEAKEVLKELKNQRDENK